VLGPGLTYATSQFPILSITNVALQSLDYTHLCGIVASSFASGQWNDEGFTGQVQTDLVDGAMRNKHVVVGKYYVLISQK
jgi:hypothetical protein